MLTPYSAFRHAAMSCLLVSVCSGAFILNEDIEGFNYEQANAMMQDNEGTHADSGSRIFGWLSGNKIDTTAVGLGDRCNDNKRKCDESKSLFCSSGLLGIGRRCFPTATTCLAAVAASFQDTFSFDDWKTILLDDVGVSTDDLKQARQEAGNFQGFQDSTPFGSFLGGFTSNPPLEQLRFFQQAANECMGPTSSDSAAGEQDMLKGPTTEGVIVYMGLHLEVGVVPDVAMSLFWALGENAFPTAFLRGTFGIELGAGAELAGLLGFAFTHTTSDILGDAVAVDFDLSLGFGGGFAVIANTNGLTSMELTFGPGLGVGLVGVAYAITCAIDTDSASFAPSQSVKSAVPSKAPSLAPSKAPSTTPSLAPSQSPSLAPSVTPPVPIMLSPTVIQGLRVKPVYNILTAAPTLFVTFNDDEGNCSTESTCQTTSVCSGLGGGSTSDVNMFPVISSFSGLVAQAPGGCCTAKSCVNSLITTEGFGARAGQTMTIQYRAIGGEDWYESAIVLYRGSPPVTESTTVVDAIIVRGRSMSAFTSHTFTIPTAGNYYVAFYTASYDRTGDGNLGARLEINGFVLA
jgi:hypothetical protein